MQICSNSVFKFELPRFLAMIRLVINCQTTSRPDHAGPPSSRRCQSSAVHTAESCDSMLVCAVAWKTPEMMASGSPGAGPSLLAAGQPHPIFASLPFPNSRRALKAKAHNLLWAGMSHCLASCKSGHAQEAVLLCHSVLGCFVP